MTYLAGAAPGGIPSSGSLNPWSGGNVPGGYVPPQGTSTPVFQQIKSEPVPRTPATNLPDTAKKLPEIFKGPPVVEAAPSPILPKPDLAVSLPSPPEMPQQSFEQISVPPPVMTDANISPYAGADTGTISPTVLLAGAALLLFLGTRR